MAPGPNDIRYVCLSDLHLGAELSLLTDVSSGSKPDVPPKASPVLQGLFDCLQSLISANQDQTRKPILILLGDILELALADDNVAAMVFERFLEQAMPPGKELFEKIVYIPGNHDHHLWESARETQYVSNYLAHTRPGDLLKIPWHGTNIFMDDDPNPPVPSFFLNNLVNRYDRLKNFNINTVYPNYGLRQDGRGVIFHHGHFIESIYQLMTTLKDLIFPGDRPPDRPIFPWDLEAENFAWIDFFWSTLGRSGDVGHGVEIIYDKMLDEEQFRKLLDNLADGLAKKYNITGLGGTGLSAWLNEKVGETVINALVNKLVYPERTQTEKCLSDDAEKGLQDYVNGPLWRQIDKERQNQNFPFPQQITFIIGHTHKPFEALYQFSSYSGGGVPVYNTGGWVVETMETSPLHGAAALLMNDNLDAASLRLYNEADNAWDYQVRVAAPPPGAADTNFRQHLEKNLVKPGGSPWAEFSGKVAEEVAARRQILLDKVA